MTQLKKLVLLIDDDSICNSVNQILIKKKFKDDSSCEMDIVTFQKPLEGFAFLLKLLESEVYKKILIILDINMPLMTGWEFLDEYARIPKSSTNVNIIMVSSSVYQSDIERANNNVNVEEFISKPITNENVANMYRKMCV